MRARSASCAVARAFIAGQIEKFDSTHLDWFRLYLRPKWSSEYVGRCDYPKRIKPRSRTWKHGYRFRCSVGQTGWPSFEDLAIGSRSYDVHGIVNGQNGGWEYITEPLTLVTSDEALVFIAGHEAFHWLRHSRQVPGHNGEPGANRFGLEWLEQFRKEARIERSNEPGYSRCPDPICRPRSDCPGDSRPGRIQCRAGPQEAQSAGRRRYNQQGTQWAARGRVPVCLEATDQENDRLSEGEVMINLELFLYCAIIGYAVFYVCWRAWCKLSKRYERTGKRWHS